MIKKQVKLLNICRGMELKNCDAISLGNAPTIDDKTTNMKACVNYGLTETCSCNKQIDIQVRNCSSYLVYNLTATSSCPERYCFGKSESLNSDFY